MRNNLLKGVSVTPGGYLQEVYRSGEHSWGFLVEPIPPDRSQCLRKRLYGDRLPHRPKSQPLSCPWLELSSP